MTTDPLLKISDLNAYYGKTRILQGIELLVYPAESVVVAGGSAALISDRIHQPPPSPPGGAHLQYIFFARL